MCWFSFLPPHQQQMDSIIAASTSIKSSVRLKKILEVSEKIRCWHGFQMCDCALVMSRVLFQIVLAFGNYMNSSKRGAAYGFRLQSLDLVSYPFFDSSQLAADKHLNNQIHFVNSCWRPSQLTAHRRCFTSSLTSSWKNTQTWRTSTRSSTLWTRRPLVQVRLCSCCMKLVV